MKKYLKKTYLECDEGEYVMEFKNEKQAYIDNLKEIEFKIKTLDDIIFDYPPGKNYSLEELESCALIIWKILEKIIIIYMVQDGNKLSEVLKFINRRQ